MSRTNRALLLVALAQLAIGAAAVFARFALTSSGPLAVSAARLTIGALPLVLLAALRGRLQADRPAYGMAAGRRRRAPRAAFRDVDRLARLSRRSRSRRCWCARRRSGPRCTRCSAAAASICYAAASILGALAGVAIVVGAPDRANTPLGIGLALLGAVTIAAYLILVRGIDARYDTLAVTSRTYSYAAVLLTLGALAVHDHLPPAGDLRAWGGILAMALLSQLFGHTALNAAVRVISATLVGTMILLEPLIATVLAAWLFGERLGTATAIGAAIILAAIGVALRGEMRY